MMSRAFRSAAAILSILLLSGVPSYAAPVAFREVIQVLSSPQNPPGLRLRSVSQTATPLLAEGVASSIPEDASGHALTITGTAVVDAGDSTLLSGIAMSVNPQGGVVAIDQGEVEGTVCDCGEITVPGGGLPKWPLLFLAAIPFFFSHGCDDCDIETPPGTPPGTPGTPSISSPIPEPASLLLFGSGLAAFGAGLRRRYARGKLAAQIQNGKEA
jgi:hypothetical protein